MSPPRRSSVTAASLARSSGTASVVRVSSTAASMRSAPHPVALQPPAAGDPRTDRSRESSPSVGGDVVVFAANPLHWPPLRIMSCTDRADGTSRVSIGSQGESRLKHTLAMPAVAAAVLAVSAGLAVASPDATASAQVATPSVVKPIKTLLATPALTIATYGGYGSSGDQTLDAYTDPGTAGKPWVIDLHGGSWAAGAKSNSDFGSRKLAAQGFVVFNTGYRLTSDYPGHDLRACGSPTSAPTSSGRTTSSRPTPPSSASTPPRARSTGRPAGHRHVRRHLPRRARDPGHRVGVRGQPAAARAGRRRLDPRKGFAGDLPTGPNRTLARWAAVAMGCPHLRRRTDCNARWNDFMPEKHLGRNDPPVYMTRAP